MRVLGETDPRLERWQPMIGQIAARYRTDAHTRADLLQEGQIAALGALGSFNPARGTLANWVQRAVWSAMHHWMEDRHHLVRVPEKQLRAGRSRPEIVPLHTCGDIPESDPTERILERVAASETVGRALVAARLTEGQVSAVGAFCAPGRRATLSHDAQCRWWRARHKLAECLRGRASEEG